MKTPTAKKRLIEILNLKLSKQNDLNDDNEVIISYCDNFGKKTVLDIVIRAYFETTVKSNEKYIAWVSVDKFNLIDEGGDKVLSSSQEKELVKFIDEYVYNYYSKLTNN